MNSEPIIECPTESAGFCVECQKTEKKVWIQFYLAFFGELKRKWFHNYSIRSETDSNEYGSSIG